MNIFTKSLYALARFNYRATQVLTPTFAKKWLSAHLPAWNDKFCPGGWFAQAPAMPTPGSSYLYPLGYRNHLIPLVPDAILVGHVIGVEPAYDPKTQNWNHETFYLIPTRRDYLNDWNLKTNLSWPNTAPSLKVCLPVGAARPALGTQVRITCDFCLDIAWGWPMLVASGWSVL